VYRLSRDQRLYTRFERNPRLSYTDLDWKCGRCRHLEFDCKWISTIMQLSRTHSAQHHWSRWGRVLDDSTNFDGSVFRAAIS